MSRIEEEEKKAILEAERLSNLFDDIKPDQLVVSGNHLFQINEC